jgi:omega-hydroxy-beta-dihydromenaquinone-9 sulfotransferase
MSIKAITGGHEKKGTVCKRRRLRLSLAAWRHLARQIDSRKSSLNWQAKLAYLSSGAVHSLLARIQHASHSDCITAADLEPPLFLLGFWRSGTTLLHELFCCDIRWGFASTYACLNFSHFLLTEKWIRSGRARETRRPMDNMLYSWTSPQEDEFALLALGAPSAYEAVIVPSLMRNPRLLLDLRCRSREEQDRWRETIRYFLRLLTVQQRKTLVLKSPTHGYRLSILASLFPLARYVVIERNPYEVFASNVKLWCTLLDSYGLESISTAEVEDFVLAAYVLHEEAIEEGVKLIDPQLIARVRYEDLVLDPVNQMEQLYKQLNLENFAAVRSELERHAASVVNHQRNRFLLSAEQVQRLNSVWGRFIEAKSYSWPEGHLTVA